jgi:hypothetical protein
VLRWGGAGERGGSRGGARFAGGALKRRRGSSTVAEQLARVPMREREGSCGGANGGHQGREEEEPGLIHALELA